VFIISIEIESQLANCILIFHFKVQLQTVSPSLSMLYTVIIFLFVVLKWILMCCVFCCRRSTKLVSSITEVWQW